MRVKTETTIVSKYFNTKWQASLIEHLDVSVDTIVRSLWVVDNPERSYQFRENLIFPPSQTDLSIVDKMININWIWFSPEKDSLSKIRIDYHHHKDILYIFNQEHRHQAMTVYDVMKPYIVD